MSFLKHKKRLFKDLAHPLRRFPWRSKITPYRILVSEIMLQQTQTSRVVNYFNAWMEKFPTVQALATSSLADVLKAWQGLGYNRRAKMLHECAKQLWHHNQGQIPTDYQGLLNLPGIGPYTAGAICAFAFNQRAVCIETNIRTVILEYFFPRKREVSESEIRGIIEKLLEQVSNYRRFYYAMMDLGARKKANGSKAHRRAKVFTKQSRFEGSLRQMRGLILRATLKEDKQALVTLQADPRFSKAWERLLKEGLIPNTPSGRAVARRGTKRDNFLIEE